MIFITPDPDPISLFVYASVHNIEFSSINSSNIASHLWDFEMWTIPLGFLFLFLSGLILGRNWKQQWKKISPGHYGIALIIAFIVVLVVGYLDVLSANSGIFGTLVEYTSGHFVVDGTSVAWWNLFFKFVLVIFAIPALCYYFFIKKDISESLGVFGFSIILYFGGLADLAYFVFAKLPLPSELPWLMGNPFISFVSTNLGYSTVNSVSLLFSVFISLIVAWVVAKILKEKF